MALAAGGSVFVIALAAAAGVLASEKAVEEVLHVALVGLVVSSASAIGGVALGAATTGADGSLLGEGFGVDVDDGGAYLLDDLGEAVGEGGGAGDDEWTGIRGVEVLLLLGAGAVGDD